MAEFLGLEVDTQLPEGFHPVGALVIVKGVDMKDGDLRLCTMSTDDIAVWEVAGMLRCCALDAERQFLADFGPDDEEDD